jgi:hypothetical protein
MVSNGVTKVYNGVTEQHAHGGGLVLLTEVPVEV